MKTSIRFVTIQNMQASKLTLFYILAIITCVLASPSSIYCTDSPPDRYRHDIRVIQSSRHSLQNAISFIDSHPEIFPQTRIEGASHPLNRQHRMIAWQTWQNVLDHILFFDSMGMVYGDLYDKMKGKQKKAPPFFAAFASFLAQYRYALEFIERMENNPDMHVLLNEPVPELGMQEGTYSKLKFRFLNVLRGAEFARLNALYLHYRSGEENPLQEGIEDDRQAIWSAGKGKGPELTLQNALRIVGDIGFTTWFPVQKNVSELMGNIKVWRPDRTLISSEQIKQLANILQPGDILLERREWYASNIGIPGFWTHAALYIGSPEQRRKFFNDPDTKTWLNLQGSKDGTIDTLLKMQEPDHYQLSTLPTEENHMPVILEAIGEGVSFTSLEHSAAADSLAVLRPRLPRRAIARAILRAFHYSGRPYDFNFDFRTDSELVCSELIYKAYEVSENYEGLNLPLSEVMGRPLISPNEIASLVDEEYDREDRQLDLVIFLDGNEVKQQAVKSSVEEFRRSWQRPKWHIWIQETENEATSKEE